MLKKKIIIIFSLCFFINFLLSNKIAIAKEEMVNLSLEDKEANVKKAKNEYKKALLDFNKTLGLALDTIVELSDEFTYIPIEINLEEEILRGIENDIDIINTQQGLKIAEENFNLAKLYYTPNVFKYIQIKYEYTEEKEILKQITINTEVKIRQAYFDLLNAGEAYEKLKERVYSA